MSVIKYFFFWKKIFFDLCVKWLPPLVSFNHIYKSLSYFNYFSFNKHCVCRNVTAKSSQLTLKLTSNACDLRYISSFKESVHENLESFELVSSRVYFSSPVVLDISSIKSSKFEIIKEGTVILKINRI